MPRIEMHGLSEAEAIGLKQRMRTLFEGASYQNDLEMTFVPSCSERLVDGTPSPFLRIIATNADDPSIFAKIENRLKGLEMDVEEVIIHGFVPKPK